MEAKYNIFVEKYGPPERWQCHDCGVIFDIYPALSFDHLCGSQIRGSPKLVYYFWKADLMSGVMEFCVTGEGDPNQTVHCTMPDGNMVAWDKRSDGDLIVFRGPKDYDVRFGIKWEMDKRLQIIKHLPDRLAEREAMRSRVSA